MATARTDLTNLMTDNRIAHSEIIKIMKSLGYALPDGVMGVCRGITMMAIQAFSVNDIKSFNNRLAFIKQHTDLAAAVEKVKIKLASQSTGCTADEELILSDYEQQIVDVLAFFDGVTLYQKPTDHSNYFGKTTTQYEIGTISALTQSKQLEQLGGLNKIKSWSNIYNPEELKSYFNFLYEMANEINKPFSLSIASDNHAIALHYDPSVYGWYVLDANNLPIKRLPMSLTLDQWVKKSLLETSNMTLFETSIYVPNNSSDIADTINQKISNSAQFSQIQAITESKANAANHNNATLAYVAAQTGDINLISELYAVGADLNKPTKDGITPTHIAAKHGHANAIKALSVGADLNKQLPLGTTASYIAAQNGHASVISALRESDADLTIRRQDCTSPIDVAIENSHIDVISELLIATTDPRRLSPINIETDHSDAPHAVLFRSATTLNSLTQLAMDSPGITLSTSI